MLDNMFNKLKTMKLWNLLWISLILVEIFTAIMNTIMGLLWWGRIDLDLLLIGTVDAFVVGLIVTVILILLFREIRKYERHSEEAILTAKEEWERTFNSMTDLIMIVDTKHKVVRANKAMSDKLRLTPSETVGITCYEHVHGFTEPPSFCPHSMCLLDGREHSVEIYEERLGGHYLVTVTPLFNATGEVVGSVHTAKDITERKKADEALKDMNTKLGTLINTIPDMVIFKDVAGRHVIVNRAVEEVTGRARDEIIGKTIEDLLPPDPAAACRKSDEEAMRQSVPTHAEERVVRSDGSISYFDMVKAPMSDDGGAVIGLVAIGRDITERKLMERSMRESEEKFRTLFDTANDAIFILGLDGNFIDINRIAHERLEYTKEEMLSLHVSKLDPPEFASRVPERFKQLRERGHAVFESAHLRKDGAVMPVEINAKIINYEDKQVILSIIRDITERKQAEKALRESESFLQTIIETEPECIKLLAADGALLQMNRAGLAMIDADSLDQVKGQSLYPLVVPEYREAFRALTENVFKGKSGTLEFEVVGLKGRRIWLDTHAVPLRNDRDEIIALLGITRDITEHKRAETALRESEKRFRILFNSGSDAIVVHRPILEGVPDNFLEVNDVTCQRLGYSREELLGLSPADIDDPADPLDMTTIRDAIRRDKQVLFEKTHVTRDGRKIPVEINARLFDWNGEPVILSVVRDITERKRTEEKLKETNTMLQTLIQAIPDVVFFKDAQNRYLIANRAMEEFTGLSQGQLLGKTDEELLPPDLAEDCRMSDERVTTTLKVVRFEEQYTRADKKGFLDTIKAPVFDDQGNLAGLVGVSRDITERKQMEEDLHRSSREKDTLLQEIHHRVKNNMQVISSLLNLQSKSINDPRMSAIFEDCQSRIRSMALVHEELYQSKNLSQIDIKHYINALLRGLSSSVYKKATVRFKITVDDLFFNIDTAIPCGLIITELVTNSFKHAFPKQAEGEIALELHRKDDMFHLSIKDNGVGLPLGFDPAKTQSLGLQLIHTLARQLGGMVEIKSVHGTETTIGFKERKNKKEAH